MSATFKGNTLAIIRDEVVIDPQNGKGREIEWQGDKDSIYGLIPFVSTTNARVRTVHNGPLHSLIATYQNVNDGATETATDRWTVNTEVLEKDGFFHPTVNAEMQSQSSPADYRKKIEEAVRDGKNVIELVGDLGLSIGSTAAYMYLELCRGATHFEDEYIVLRRSRTVSANYPTKMSLFSNRLIYASAQLPVPGNVLFTLPSIPAVTPANTQYGWRLRTQSSDFVGNRIEQQYEWIFAAWSLLYYQVSGANFV